MESSKRKCDDISGKKEELVKKRKKVVEEWQNECLLAISRLRHQIDCFCINVTDYIHARDIYDQHRIDLGNQEHTRRERQECSEFSCGREALCLGFSCAHGYCIEHRGYPYHDTRRTPSTALCPVCKKPWNNFEDDEEELSDEDKFPDQYEAGKLSETLEECLKQFRFEAKEES